MTPISIAELPLILNTFVIFNAPIGNQLTTKTTSFHLLDVQYNMAVLIKLTIDKPGARSQQ
jgi:hypothetical protein